MFDFVSYSAERLQIFMLVVLRGSGLIVFAPILGHRAVPKLAKIGLLLLLAGLVTSTINPQTIPVVESGWQLLGMAIKCPEQKR